MMVIKMDDWQSLILTEHLKLCGHTTVRKEILNVDIYIYALLIYMLYVYIYGIYSFYECIIYHIYVCVCVYIYIYIYISYIYI